MLLPSLLLLAPFAADVAILTPTQDNTIYDGGPSSNGAGDHMFAGMTAAGARRRALVQFDTTGAVPAGSRVTAVELRLELSQSSSGTKTVTVHRVLASWGEGASNAILMEGTGAPAEPGDATWEQRFHPTTNWGTPGGDIAAASASFSAGGLGTYTIPGTLDLVADVQGWVDSPATNFGWLLRGAEAGGKSAKRFDSRNLPTAPRLTITFEPPPSLAAEVSTISLGAGGSQPMSLFEDPARAGDLYWVLGSATGTSPGLPFDGGLVLPLNFDAYLRLTLTKPFLGIFGGFLGVLDANGRATPSLTLPSGADPGLAGVTLSHAAMISSTFGAVEAVSNAVSVTLVP